MSDSGLCELINREYSDNSESEYSDGSELDFTSENEDSGNEVDGDNEIVSEIHPGTWFMTGVERRPFPFCGQPGLNMQIEEILYYICSLKFYNIIISSNILESVGN